MAKAKEIVYTGVTYTYSGLLLEMLRNAHYAFIEGDLHRLEMCLRDLALFIPDDGERQKILKEIDEELEKVDREIGEIDEKIPYETERDEATYNLMLSTLYELKKKIVEKLIPVLLKAEGVVEED